MYVRQVNRMTNGEAKIKIRKILLAEIDKLPSHYDTDIGEQVFDNTAEVNELLELNKIVSEAFDALERQIPKKPICREQGTTVILNGVCPRCSNVVHEYDNYCAFCGQKLNWSDEERK